MTVKELKTKLESYDDDASVFIGIDTVAVQRIDNLWSVEKPNPEDERFVSSISNQEKRHCVILSN